MIKIDSFVTALKVTWFRRQIAQTDSSWSSLSNINISSLLTKVNNYAHIKAYEINNPFWKDMLLSWKQFCQAVDIETLEEILNSPIKINSYVNREHNLFIKEWHDKGIRNVIDLLNAEEQFYHFNERKDTYDIHGTSLDYQSILRKLPAF